MGQGTEKQSLALWMVLGAFTIAGQLAWVSPFADAVPHPVILFPLFLVAHVLFIAFILFRMRFRPIAVFACLASLILGEWYIAPASLAFLAWSIHGFAP
jgi:hypothetical protein